MSALLTIENVSKRFGGLAAVDCLNAQIEAGELVGLIGPNGAGKTTVFNLMTGVYAPTTGTITFDGKRINGLKPFQVTRLGMARTFQNIRLFRELTALENVKIAANLRGQASLFSALFRSPGLLKNDAYLDEIARSLLAKMSLSAVADAKAGDLAYGLQRRLEIARALATSPKMLLLDEPAAGMNPQEKVALMQLIRAIRADFNLTILLIEHDMKLVMGVCERIYVLDYGRVLAEGTPQEIRSSPKVIAAYLGEDLGEAEEEDAPDAPQPVGKINR